MTPGASRSIRIASFVYGMALRLYPFEFRRRYADQMHATFTDVCRDALSANRRHVFIRVAARELINTAFAAHAARRIGPSGPSSERRPPVLALRQDIRFALRMLIRQPGFTAVAILTLALGIGANTAVFTVVNGVLLRPLPYGDPARLVVLLNGHTGRMSGYFSPLNYLDFANQAGAFSDSAAYAPETVNLTGSGEPQRVRGASVAWNFFRVLDVTFAHGRPFVENDAREGRPTVVVLSQGLWKRAFGGRADLLGTAIRFDGRPMTVIGIAPDGVKLPGDAEFWRPLVFAPRDMAPNARGAQWVMAVARLKPGVTLNEANSALAAVASRLAAAYPRTNEGRLAMAIALHDRVVQNVRSALIVLLGAVAFVLLIACVNVANLLLARAQARGREVVVRMALGASRRRLIQQLLSESLLLAMLGAGAGLVVASLATRALVALAPATVPRLADVVIDLRVLGFTIATAIVTSVLFGMAPALAASGVSADRLVSAGRGAVGAPGTRSRRALVVCELALAVVLLTGAGLLVRSYQALQRVSPGFDAGHVLTFNVSLPAAKYPDETADGAFVARLVERLEATPGVSSAAAVFGLPLDTEFSAHSSFRRPGDQDSENMPSAGMRIATPDYFRTMRIPVKGGRTFESRDTDSSTEVVVVNEQAARRFWPGRDPIGQQIHVGVNLTEHARSGWKTIVGIVGDVRYGGLDLEAPPEIYLPYAQHAVDTIAFVVRVEGEPMALAPTLRRDVAAIDPELPLEGVRSMADVVGSSVAERRFTMLLIAAFAGIAMVLAAIGIYGVLAYLVSQRTQEIGVRVALGASRLDVMRLFVGEGARLAGLGVACGLAGSLAVTRVLTSLLFGVSATDPVTLGAVSTLLVTVALLASYLPARRAARVDPMTALRTD